MKQLTKSQSQEIARSMCKGYLKLLSQQVKKAAHSIDAFFFVEGDQESEEIRPYFYGAISFGVAVVLFVFVTVN